MGFIDKFISIFNKKVEEIEGIKDKKEKSEPISDLPETKKESDIIFNIEDKNISPFIKKLLKSQKELYDKIDYINKHYTAYDPSDILNELKKIKNALNVQSQNIYYVKDGDISPYIRKILKSQKELSDKVNHIYKKIHKDSAITKTDSISGLDDIIKNNYKSIKRAIEDSFSNVFIDLSNKNNIYIDTIKNAFVSAFNDVITKIKIKDDKYVKKLHDTTKNAFEEAFNSASTECNKLLEKQKEIIEKTTDKQKELIEHHYKKLTGKIDDILFIFPINGGSYEFPSGDNIIDFLDGYVYFADNTKQKLSMSLVGSDHNVIRALKVVSNKEIKIKLNNNGYYSVNSIKIKHFEVSQLSIQCESATKIKIIASTSPDFDVDLDGEYTAIGDGTKTVTNAGTRVQLSDTSVPCSEVHITARSDNQDVIVVGGSTVVAELSNRRGIALNPSDTIVLKINDLSKIYIDAVIDNDKVTYTYTS